MTKTNYNYYETVKADVKDWIENNLDIAHDIYNGDFEDREDIETYLNDTLWIEDSVTGNASGSYTFNREEAKENVLNDIETVVDAYNEFCDDIGRDLKENNWERMDVTARCYLLGQAIAETLDEIDGAITEAIRDREAEKENA